MIDSRYLLQLGLLPSTASLLPQDNVIGGTYSPQEQLHQPDATWAKPLGYPNPELSNTDRLRSHTTEQALQV